MEHLSILCIFCKQQTLRKIIDFGKVALAGAFLKPEQFPGEKKYPLCLAFCEHCYAVQVTERIHPSVLFKNYFYFSSAIGTLREHFIKYAEDVVNRFLPSPTTAVVAEIGCNDGILLKHIAEHGVHTVIGIDPAQNVVATINDPRITVINDYFDVVVAERAALKYGQADLVLANNVFAHIEDIHSVTEGVKKLLKDDGIFIFEVHYLGKILEELQYDFIYHEHLFYYSLLALENHLVSHDMVIFDVQPISIHGGSMRYYACKKTSMHAKHISKAVDKLRADERLKRYDSFDRYAQFAKKCAQRRNELISLLNRLQNEKKRIVGYGASGRANTIMQYCGIDQQYIECVIDDAPMKQGYYTPGTHVPICNKQVLTTQPDYVLIFAWTFYNEIANKSTNYISNGGRFIIPLPTVLLYPTK